ncbi:MAG TPA: protein kinase [Gemmatimonadaceae bacterium]|nr:protein kinase [Gemmatimonadaceae bacterium]
MPTSSVTCPGCGSLVPLGDRFCGSCGTPITGSALMSGEGSRFDPWEELLQKLRQATIGEYEIKGELGRGGMAAVLLAHDLQLNRKVAIKVMLPGLVYGASMWDRFLSEARTAAKLDHPNIIYIHSVKEKDRFLYFVMKYIDGRTLDDILAQHPALPVPVAQTVLVEVARGLDYAHHEGVVHRDIKPANIMIDQKGNAIVMDFGIARATDEKRFTQTGATIGTPAYMSPEQCRGAETDAQSDQYSLGVLAYEMLAGAPPFSGTPIELQIAHMQDSPRSLRDLRPEVSLELSGAVMRMLSKDPTERFPSLGNLVPIFGRGLDPHDDGPRSHLVSLVKAGSQRRKSFPVTPASLSPALPSERTRPVSTAELAENARKVSAESNAIVSGHHGAPSGAQSASRPDAVTYISESTPVAPISAVTPVSTEAVSPDHADDAAGVGAGTEAAQSVVPPVGAEPYAPAAEAASRGKSLWTVLALAGVAVGGVAWAVLSRGTKQAPVPEAEAAPPPTVAAAAAVEAAMGDSVVIGHGADATRSVNGKVPRTVTPDAVSLLVLSMNKPHVRAGDTVRVRLDATDDAGAPVTTPQTVWTTSNAAIVRLLAPGVLSAEKIGKATLTVTAGTASSTLAITVEPRSAAAAKGTAVPKSAAPAKPDSSGKRPPR